MKAIWNNQIIAESNNTIIIEGKHYFPPSSVKTEYLNTSTTHTICNLKGQASYFTIAVNGQINIDAAWCYPSPYNNAKNITNYFAFWKGVKITD